MTSAANHPSAASLLDQTRAMVLWCAKQGWPIFPCRLDKTPLVKTGFKAATCDLTQLRTWWAHTAHPIGLATGAAGLVVIDLDTPKPGTMFPAPWNTEPGITDGADILAHLALDAGQDWPHTRTITTPTGGQHLYYHAPTGSPITSSVSKLGPLIDIRAHGGYVIIPPSVTPTGTYTTTNPGPIRPLPDWLTHHLTTLARTPISTTTGGPGSGSGLPPAGTPRAKQYTQAAITKELRTLLNAPEGTRNHTLNKAAYNLGQLINTGHLTPADIHTILAPAALAIGLTEAETRTTIESGTRSGTLTPRKAAA